MPRPTSSRLVRARFAAAKYVVVLAVLGYGGLLAALYTMQERLIFPGTPLPADHRFHLDQRFEELAIPVPGATLDALRVMQDDPRGLVFYLHGNGGNVETWTSGVDFWRRVNYDLFMLDYRGYGKSTGTIDSQAQLEADVRAAWDAIAPRYRGKPIVVFGRSLGTGLAARLARDVDPALLVLVTPYASLAAAAKRAYPIAPEWLLKYPLRTDLVIGEVKSPVLIAHGSADALIPVADSRRLQALARAPAELLVVEGADHHDIQRFPAYLDGLARALDRAAAR